VRSPTTNPTRLSRAALAGWAGLILLGSLLPPSAVRPAMPAFSGADLVIHAASYALLCLLAVWAWPLKRHGWVALAVLLFGALLELLQPLTGRALSGYDMIANAAGVGGGLLTGGIIRARRAARRT